MVRLVYPGLPETLLIATEGILLDSEIHFDTLIERLPEPLSHCGLMRGPLSKRQSFFPYLAQEKPLNLLFSTIFPTT